MIRFRQAEVGDEERIHAVHTSSILELCSTSYSVESVKKWAARQTPSQYTNSIESGEITLALSSDHVDEIIGFGHLISSDTGERETETKECEIKGLFVSPKYVRRGVGRSLVQHMEQQAKERGFRHIRVRSSINAKEFYQKMGYCIVNASDVHVRCDQTLQCILMNKQLLK